MKKTFMLVSALAMVAMSIVVTSCKKDKDDEPSNVACTCYYTDGEKEVITAEDFGKGGFYEGLSCRDLNEEVTYWEEGYCK